MSNACYECMIMILLSELIFFGLASSSSESETVFELNAEKSLSAVSRMDY